MFLYEYSETPGPQNESSQKHNVPALINPVVMHQPTRILEWYRLMHNERDLSMQRRCVSGIAMATKSKQKRNKASLFPFFLYRNETSWPFYK